MTTQDTNVLSSPGHVWQTNVKSTPELCSDPSTARPRECQAHPESQALLTMEQESAKPQHESLHNMAGVVPDLASRAASVDTDTMGNSKFYQTKGPGFTALPRLCRNGPDPNNPSTCCSKVGELRPSVHGFW